MIVIRFRELDPSPADFLVRGSPWDQFVEQPDRARPTAVLFSTARRRQSHEQTTFSTLGMMDSGLHRLVDAPRRSRHQCLSSRLRTSSSPRPHVHGFEPFEQASKSRIDHIDHLVRQTPNKPGGYCRFPASSDDFSMNHRALIRANELRFIANGNVGPSPEGRLVAGFARTDRAAGRHFSRRRLITDTRPSDSAGCRGHCR